MRRLITGFIKGQEKTYSASEDLWQREALRRVTSKTRLMVQTLWLELRYIWVRPSLGHTSKYLAVYILKVLRFTWHTDSFLFFHTLAPLRSHTCSTLTHISHTYDTSFTHLLHSLTLMTHRSHTYSTLSHLLHYDSSHPYLYFYYIYS